MRIGCFVSDRQTLDDYGALKIAHHMSEPMRLQNAAGLDSGLHGQIRLLARHRELDRLPKRVSL
jgi:hypothetical protein